MPIADALADAETLRLYYRHEVYHGHTCFLVAFPAPHGYYTAREFARAAYRAVPALGMGFREAEALADAREGMED